MFRIPVQDTTKDPYFTAYYNEFNRLPTPRCEYTFSPPVSMYPALLIALESGGWNATSLQNMAISVELEFIAFGPNGWSLICRVISPAVDWSPQPVNDTTYRYVWTIIVQYSGPVKSIPPPGYYYVDAATAELVPTGELD